MNWNDCGPAANFAPELGSCVKINDEQIAIFNLQERGWYATQNLCPHEKRMVLARGLTGDAAGEPKVVCPLHKRNFSLKTGCQIGDSDCGQIRTYPVKVENGRVLVQL